VSISDHQRRPIPDANGAATGYNGVDTDRLAFKPTGGAYLAWLGRISPDKGLDRAIQIARLAGMPLKVAARLPLHDRSNPEVRSDWTYYETVVKPLLADGDVEFVGEVGDGDKTAFLGNAVALLNPIDWPEPFGLVMAEALSCGTPVVARRCGSVPELVSHGLTGLIGETDEELAQLCREAGAIKRSLCRQEAVYRFSVEAMTLGYERAYDGVIAGAGWTSPPAYSSRSETLVAGLEPGA
jgi:glycosyltransferase involved in cell wall biosynthesis